MQKILPDRSLIIKNYLEIVVAEILNIAEAKIAMIILFGSYARGDWVQDAYVKDHITYTYQSDIDILLIMKKGKYVNFKIEDKIKKKLHDKSLIGVKFRERWITFVCESINHVNRQLEKGHYFFSDIKKEGVLLYDSGEFTLAEHKELPWHRRREIAIEDYGYWFKRGESFFNTAKYTINQGDNSLTAFLLHQATECFYNTILLVFTGYKPKIHDIKILSSIANNYNEELWKIFPLSNSEQITCFDLLVRAYIEARYEKNYHIDLEQLNYLFERIQNLRIVTEEICLAKINSKE